LEIYGLRLEELRDIAAEILDRELIDYLDLALWDSRQLVQDGAFCGKTMLSVFTELLRKGVRVGAAGRIMGGAARWTTAGRGMRLCLDREGWNSSAGFPATGQEKSRV